MIIQDVNIFLESLWRIDSRDQKNIKIGIKKYWLKLIY